MKLRPLLLPATPKFDESFVLAMPRFVASGGDADGDGVPDEIEELTLTFEARARAPARGVPPRSFSRLCFRRR